MLYSSLPGVWERLKVVVILSEEFFEYSADSPPLEFCYSSSFLSSGLLATLDLFVNARAQLSVLIFESVASEWLGIEKIQKYKFKSSNLTACDNHMRAPAEPAGFLHSNFSGITQWRHFLRISRSKCVIPPEIVALFGLPFFDSLEPSNP